jgi:ubiquinone/menaquinone biosynthesis C-methylase UbiE
MAATRKPPLTPERIMQFAWGYAFPLIIESAIRNGVFDALDGGAQTIEQLRRRTKASPRGLRAILDAMVSVDLIRKAGNRYSLTPESSTFLVHGKPTFHGGIFKHISTQLIPNWLKLSDIVRNGKPATVVNAPTVGAKFFHDFVEDIFTMSYAAAQTLGDALKISASKEPISVLDLAAGSGVWGIALAEKSPKVRVTAVDWPQVIPVTKRVAKRFGVANRFRFIEGDILAADFGRGHHVATLGHILHSEGEARSRKLLSRTFKSLAPGGTIAIAEFTPNDDRTGPPGAMIFGVNMLVNTQHGDVFTLSEVGSWLSEVGFKNVRTLEAPAPSPLILATKPK